MTTLNGSTVEAAALEWLAALGWRTAHGPDIALHTPGSKRNDYRQVVLERRREALVRLTSSLLEPALEDAVIRPSWHQIQTYKTMRKRCDDRRRGNSLPNVQRAASNRQRMGPHGTTGGGSRKCRR